VREEIVDPERRVELLAPLGFGAANVVVAVPAAWIDVRCMADLADVCGGFRARHGRGMRVATKYVNTRVAILKSMESPIIALWKAPAPRGRAGGGLGRSHRRHHHDWRDAEGQCAENLDDGVILRSQANLVASLAAPWSEAAREAARIILSRIAAEERPDDARIARQAGRRQRQAVA